MNYVIVLKQIEDHLANCKRELTAGNEFQAERSLVKLREYLNSQPELKAGGAHKSAKPSRLSSMWEHLH